MAQIWEQGEEFVLDQPNNGKYVPLNSAAVFNNKQTQALWDFSKNPAEFILGDIKTTPSNLPDITNSSVNIQLSAPIAITGNATAEGVDALSNKLKRRLLPALSKELMKEMVKVGKYKLK